MIKQYLSTNPYECLNIVYAPYKRYLVAFSGGKDSVAMVLHLLEIGVNKSQIELHHHDIDGYGDRVFDWPCTESYCRAFAAHFGLKIIFSYREGGIKREIYRQNEGLQSVWYDGKELKSKPGNSTRLKFPAVSKSLQTRWCSSTVKIDVLSRLIVDKYKSGNFLICTGERREESGNRNKYWELIKYRKFSKKRNAWQWRTIINWTEKQVWDIIERWKVQPHPCYMLGWSRCSCKQCIYSTSNTWATNNELDPNSVNVIGLIEKDINHTLYNGISIERKVQKGTSFLVPENVNRWKEEALGEFVSPIIVDKWVLPQGAFSKEKAGSV